MRKFKSQGVGGGGEKKRKSYWGNGRQRKITKSQGINKECKFYFYFFATMGTWR
jgi:hypothetical protein